MIKNIIYLDEAKMYSLSSQIFEGITEYMLKETNAESEDSEQQRGPLASGRVLADAMRYGERSIEKRFLHDHSFSIFENKLGESDLVFDVNEGVEDVELGSKAFVRVSAPATFIDAAKVTSLMSSFNEIGEALAYITNFPAILEVQEELGKQNIGSLDKAKLASARQREKILSNTAELAKTAGLYQDPKFLKHLARVTEFGFSNQLEVQQRVGEFLYSSCLKRQCLREPDDLTIRKYSRKTEKKLVVLGIATQTAATPLPQSSAMPESSSPSMKAAVTNLVEHIANLESSMVGKSSDEVVIDPIAVYITL